MVSYPAAYGSFIPSCAISTTTALHTCRRDMIQGLRWQFHEVLLTSRRFGYSPHKPLITWFTLHKCYTSALYALLKLNGPCRFHTLASTAAQFPSPVPIIARVWRKKALQVFVRCCCSKSPRPSRSLVDLSTLPII